MRKESMEFLKTLLSTPSPSGHESANQRIWCDYARQYADEVHTDAYGNAVAILNPDGNPKIVLDGHVDEIGMVIQYIDEKGFLYVQRLGGVNPALVQSKRIDIHTAKGIVRGVVGATAIHLRDRSKDSGDQKVPKWQEIFVDIGAKDRKGAEKKVAVGDPITFVDDFEMLDKNLAVARAFDNRAGVWSVIEALRIASKGKPKCAIYACSSIQEETGLNGAAMQAGWHKPDVAIAVDVTHATDTPGIDVKQHGEVKMGEGPSLSLGREHHPAVTRRIREVAKNKDIPLQIENFSLSGGTDAYAYWTKNGGTPVALLSIPNRYMHSTVEMLDLRDLQKVAELLAGFCLSVKKDEQFRVEV